MQNADMCSNTWDNVTKANGGHGDEAEVKSIKECQLLHYCEGVGTDAQEETENQKTSKSCLYVAGQAIIFFLLLISERKIIADCS